MAICPPTRRLILITSEPFQNPHILCFYNDLHSFIYPDDNDSDDSDNDSDDSDYDSDDSDDDSDDFYRALRVFSFFPFTMIYLVLPPPYAIQRFSYYYDFYKALRVSRFSAFTMIY